MTIRPQIVIWAAVTVSLMLFVTSLGMPALEFAAQDPVSGGTALCWGWCGVFTGDFPWFANPLYFAAVLFALAASLEIKQVVLGRITSQIFCGLALGVGMLSLLVREWHFEYSKGTLVQSIGIAFYYWMGSFLALLLLLFFVRKEDPSAEDEVGADE